MRESGYYPPGAEFDPSAPWNEREPEEREFDIEASFDLRRNDAVLTADYDGDGNLNDPRQEWKRNHMTPLELIEECKQLATAMLSSLDDTTRMGKEARRHLRHVIEECDGWENVYEEFNQV